MPTVSFKKIKIIIPVALLFVVTTMILAVLQFNLFTKDAEIAYSTCDATNTSCLSEVALINAKNLGVSEALQGVSGFFASDINNSLMCHVTLHKVGEVFYENFGDKSLTVDADLCAGAYYHGALYGMLETVTPTPTPAKAGVVLKNTCEFMSDELSKLSRTCIHGVGHASYMLYNDLDASLDSCFAGKYSDPYMDSCISGAFMEFSVSGESWFEFKENSFKACSIYVEKNSLKNCLFFILSQEILDNNVTLEEFCSGVLASKAYPCESIYGSSLGYTVANSTSLGGLSGFKLAYLKASCQKNIKCYKYYTNSVTFLTAVEANPDPSAGVSG